MQKIVLVFFLVSSVQYNTFGENLPEGTFQIPKIEFSTPDADLTTLDSLVGNREIVALGEATHTNGYFHDVNARLAKYLIEKKGFDF